MTNANKASCTIDRTPLTAMDCKILNKVAKLVIKHGAISVERLAAETKYFERTVRWALFLLNAECTTADLYFLPEPADRWLSVAS